MRQCQFERGLQLEYYSLKEIFKGDLLLGVDETEPELKNATLLVKLYSQDS